MSFILFFRGMLVALLVFAAAMYLLTGSLWTTFLQTIACAVLLQVGYFIGVLLMVWRGSGKPQASVVPEEVGPWERAGKPKGDSRDVSGSTSPHRP